MVKQRKPYVIKRQAELDNLPAGAIPVGNHYTCHARQSIMRDLIDNEMDINNFFNHKSGGRLPKDVADSKQSSILGALVARMHSLGLHFVRCVVKKPKNEKDGDKWKWQWVPVHETEWRRILKLLSGANWEPTNIMITGCGRTS